MNEVPEDNFHEKIQNKKFIFSYTCTLPGINGKEGEKREGKIELKNGETSSAVTGLPIGTQCTVTEETSNLDIDGYKHDKVDWYGENGSRNGNSYTFTITGKPEKIAVYTAVNIYTLFCSSCATGNPNNFYNYPVDNFNNPNHIDNNSDRTNDLRVDNHLNNGPVDNKFSEANFINTGTTNHYDDFVKTNIIKAFGTHFNYNDTRDTTGCANPDSDPYPTGTPPNATTASAVYNHPTASIIVCPSDTNYTETKYSTT
ncbi:DUF5979 domain-containing protein [Corynebacterium kutscheri]|uniref:DUF5979 domain-containing protein n=1 Tax=Corynebacterium kutscheri TaxID=35755 RepID=UPI00130EA61D|nr:DUF5979 domain-containing protein [Corynebacterium kutscheri]